MKNLSIGLAALACLLSISFSGQTNETPNEYYDWGKKDTTPQSGYIVLKSGTKIDGDISLIGSPGHVEEVEILTKSGDTKKIPAGSLDKYGLYVVRAVCDSPEELFKWGMGNTSTNAKGVSTHRRKTKWQPGYLVLGDGSRLEGEIQLKEENGGIKSFHVDVAGDKKDFANGEIANYGLLLTMSDMGKKNGNDYNDPGRNFNPGWVETVKGERFEGYVAFIGIYGLEGNQYSGVNFARSESALVQYFAPTDIKNAGQTVNGKETEYQEYNGGIISTEQFLSAGEGGNDETKAFQTGVIRLLDGSQKKGQVKQNKPSLMWYATDITLVDASDNIENFNPSQVDYFEQTFGEETHRYIVEQGVFVELMQEGENFWLYRNPFPTSSYKFLSGVAAVATEALVDTLTKAAAHKQVEQAIEGNNDNLGEDLESLAEANAAGHEIAGAIDFKRKEYVVWNLKRDEKTIFNTKNYDDKIKELLMGCETFIFMDKNDQKPFYNFDNVVKAFELLNQCY